MHPLTDFLAALLDTGQVTVAGQLTPFADDDRAAARARLRRAHATAALEVAHQAPDFAPAAAGWAAEFLYRTTQLAFLRDYDEDAIAAHLADWPGPVTAEVIFSVDLLFGYLPTLLSLARGLAPADPLVIKLQAVARQWPLSFGGVGPPAPGAPAEVLAHPALRRLYLDRLIERRDREWAAQSGVADGVREALGGHAELLWPDFNQFIAGGKPDSPLT